MLDISDTLAAIMASGNYVFVCRVDSWYGDTLVASDIPVASGTVSWDATLAVPESASITVPRVDDQGNIWAPGADIGAALACNGQQLHVSVLVEIASGQFETMSLGTFYITESDSDDTTVTVQADGLLGLIQEAELITPFNPSGNFTTVIRQIIEPALTVDFTNAPVDAALPANTVQDSGRLDAFHEILDAWPAQAFVDEDGLLNIATVGDTNVSSLSLTDGAGGTTMRWGNRLSRDGAASAVVARGTTAAGVDVQAVAYDSNSASPTYINGPFNELPVPFDYYSPLLTTVAQCQAAANTILARRKRQACIRLHVDAVPYLALQVRDGVTITSTDLDLTNVFGIVDQITLPLTPADGAMSLGIRVPV